MSALASKALSRRWWSKHFLIATLLSVIGLGFVIVEIRDLLDQRQQMITIALVAPMSGKDAEVGREMARSVRLYLDQLEEDARIELRIHDDKGDPRQAEQIARQLAGDDDVALVLGHYAKEAALAAAPIYRENGLPAITGTVTADALILDNSWYFSLLPVDSSQGAQIAAFINKVLGVRKASIVYDSDGYGSALLKGFEATADGLGMELVSRIAFDRQSGGLDAELESVAATLRAMGDPGMVFLATHPAEGVKLITSLYGEGLQFFGPDSFSEERFLELLNTYPQEKVKPGYFIDGVFSTVPMIPDIAQRQAKEFHYHFERRYQQAPGWIGAAYRDAAMLGVSAITKAASEGRSGTPASLRAAVKFHLSQTNMPERSMFGVMGNIQFDAHGAAVKPLPVAVFKGHNRVSYREQLQLVRDIRRIENPLREILEGRLLYQNDRFNHRTKVVYTGVDINEITNLDVSDSSFTADFYIWFRTELELDPRQIEFLNAAEPVELGDPVVEELNADGLITYTFRVRSQFRGDFDFYRYPFDSQELPIRFKHSTLTRPELIFVPDVMGMRMGEDKGGAREAGFQAISGWNYYKALFYQDEISNNSSLGIEKFFEDSYALEFSRFNATVTIARDATSFILKNLFPMFFVILLSYVTFYISNYNPRLNMVASALLTAAFFHLKLSAGIPVGYLVAIEYFFFAVYILIGIALLASITTHRLFEYASSKGEAGARAGIWAIKIDLIGRIIYPILVVVMIYAVIARFTGFGWG